ncbi:MAG TPA: AAA family ATPase [Candidatus Bilophila faecipullorum]|uniref:AAA family ATPase n=1 Tax=Candidatus Bilophila faecipullorum TaxID=2838482 RepID=A0A9D1R3H9_9BACT|nr:AAA family ATPase [uncultured Bilophila sp.]HIW79432.1 AAA family ATPase [Candidatus Bilophila faecipullorum]
MYQGRIIIITGSPGSGKTTVAKIIAKESDFTKSVHIHTDDFYHYLSKGAIPPHLPESQKQNSIVVEAFLETAKCYARNGYDVIVDGIIGPWFLTPWIKTAQDGYEIHYIILRANKEETMKRAIERTKLSKEMNVELVEIMWNQFAKMDNYESFVITTTDYSINETTSIVKKHIREKSHLLI